jgi:hypothetical protein
MRDSIGVGPAVTIDRNESDLGAETADKPDSILSIGPLKRWRSHRDGPLAHRRP